MSHLKLCYLDTNQLTYRQKESRFLNSESPTSIKQEQQENHDDDATSDGDGGRDLVIDGGGDIVIDGEEDIAKAKDLTQVKKEEEISVNDD